MSNHKFIYSIFFSHQIILLLGIVILFSGCANEDEPEQEPVNREEISLFTATDTIQIPSLYRLGKTNLVRLKKRL